MGDAGMDWERNFRERMAALRIAAGMTQTDLARVLRERYDLPFHQVTIGRIEAGERPIRLNEAHLIAQAFNTDLDAMMEAHSTPAIVYFTIRKAAEALAASCTAVQGSVMGAVVQVEMSNQQVEQAWATYFANQQAAGGKPDPELLNAFYEWKAMLGGFIERADEFQRMALDTAMRAGGFLDGLNH